MAIYLSSGLVNKLAGSGKQHIVRGTTISFNFSLGQILDSADGLDEITGSDKLIVNGSTSNDGTYTVTGLSSPAGSYVEVSETLVDESATADIVIACMGGGNSFKEIFRNGVLELYSGTRPSDADNSEAGTKLLRITQNSGDFTPGTSINGLTFEDPDETAGSLSKPSGETWSGLGLADGTATWFRFYDNDYTSGASSSGVRFDGTCGVGSGDLRLTSTAILEGGTVTLDSVAYTFPRT